MSSYVSTWFIYMYNIYKSNRNNSVFSVSCQKLKKNGSRLFAMLQN